MYALLLTVAVALAGQVAAGSGSRYGDESATGNATSGATTQPLQTWSDEQRQQGVPETQSVLPRQPRQLNPNLPTDYRTQGSANGQQNPNSLLRADNGRSIASPSSNHVATEAEAIAEVKPSQLISSLLKPPTNGQLVGSVLSLAEAVGGANSRNEQTERVEAYWDLSAATANYYMALREVIALQTLQQSVTQPSVDWGQARRDLNLRGKAARRSAQAAQVRLQRMIGQTGPLPVTSDLPHCGAYDTRYAEIFNGRLPSAEAQQLDELLPLSRQEIRNQASNVVSAQKWREIVSQRRTPDTDGSGLLKAHNLLSLSRRAFVLSLRDYNVNIARYAEIATPGQVVTDRLVAMLIYTEDGSSRGIRRTSGVEALGSRGNGQPRTFAEGQWNQSDTGAEHSILKRPKGQ